MQKRKVSKTDLSEAATLKASVLRFAREIDGILANKAMPESLRKEFESFRASLRKSWTELEKEAGREHGHKGLASAPREKAQGEVMETKAKPVGTVPADETKAAEPVAEGDYKESMDYVPMNVISFSQLQNVEAAAEIAENMREAVGQFAQMLNNIFFWYSDEQLPDKVGAARTLFDEFIGVVGGILTGQSDEEPVLGGQSESEPGEPESLAESYAPTVTIHEAEGDANPRGSLEMDVQLIRPGWGNSRDNHYYPAEMLRRDAAVFEGAKMYSTDHRPEEKSERTEVSKIQRIIGFTEAGAPIARVVVFDPDFAEKTRNRAKAGVLDSLECSILADGRAKPGFEEGGRKGKVVEMITAVSSVDWVTRAGAGGKALALAESAQGAGDNPQSEEVPVGENENAESVSIQEQDQPAAEEQPAEHPEESVSTETPTESAEQPAPAFLSLAEISEALQSTSLPGKSVLALISGQYADAAALNEAVLAETARVKEISGSGRPFAMGEHAAVSQESVSRAKIEESMDSVLKRFGIGR